MDNKTVTMAHGAGGRQTSELIDEVFKAHFANPVEQLMTLPAWERNRCISPVLL